MGPIHLITLSTSLLDFYYENMGLNSVGDDEAKDELKRFQKEIIKARESATPSKVQIRWETEFSTLVLVNEFAQEQNKLINL